MLTFTTVSVSAVSIFTDAMVTSLCVYTIGVDIAFMFTGTAFVQFRAVESIHSLVAWQAFAFIGTVCVDTFGV